MEMCSFSQLECFWGTTISFWPHWPPSWGMRWNYSIPSSFMHLSNYSSEQRRFFPQNFCFGRILHSWLKTTPKLTSRQLAAVVFVLLIWPKLYHCLYLLYPSLKGSPSPAPSSFHLGLTGYLLSQCCLRKEKLLVNCAQSIAHLPASK